MNEKLERYIRNKRKEKQKKLEDFLIEEGLFDTVYAPGEITGTGHIKNEGTILTFPVKSENMHKGDTVKVAYQGKTVEVIVDNLEFKQYEGMEYDYPGTEYSAEYNCCRNYKRVPIELSDEDYAALDEYCNFKSVGKDKNVIASVLTFVAVIIFFTGFIAGFVLMDESGIAGAACWIFAFIYGSFILGFAEIIKLLTAIKHKR